MKAEMKRPLPCVVRLQQEIKAIQHDNDGLVGWTNEKEKEEIP